MSVHVSLQRVRQLQARLCNVSEGRWYLCWAPTAMARETRSMPALVVSNPTSFSSAIACHGSRGAGASTAC